MTWLKRLGAIYHHIIHAGVDSHTPAPLADRVIYSNLISLICGSINVCTASLNFAKGYHLLFAVNFVYFAGVILCVALNIQHRYLTARFCLLGFAFAGFIFSCLIQGSQFEMEHYFLPMGVLAFTVFYAEERFYSFFFLILAIGFYLLFISQVEPLLDIDPARGRYSESDLLANRLTYLALFFACMYSLATAFDRALRLLDEQRTRLFEERRLVAMGAMACNVAHEINSPLTAMDLQIFQLSESVAKNGVNAKELQDRLGRMSHISRRMASIIRGLKFLSGQNDNDPFSQQEVDSVLGLAVDLCRDRIEEHHIQLSVMLSGHKAEIFCRPVSLSQVFLNLLNNAIDAVADLPPAQKTIEVTSRRFERNIEISIEDGGFMATEIKDSLFKAFFSTKAPGKGTGLGLSVSKETVEEHGGSLRLDEGSRRTRFVILLPLKSEQV